MSTAAWHGCDARPGLLASVPLRYGVEAHQGTSQSQDTGSKTVLLTADTGARLLWSPNSAPAPGLWLHKQATAHTEEKT